MKNSGSRGRLFRKYVVVLLVLVGGVLMASSLVELYFSYRETQRAIVRVERAKAVAAAAGIEQFLKEVEQQVRETTRTASDDPDASQVGQGRLGFRQGLGTALAEQRELDFLRALRNVPAVSELSHLDLAGKEQLRVSRLDPDVVGSQADFSQSPKFVEARAGKTYWSPVYLKNESEPYVTLAVPVGTYAVEVTTAEVSLGAVLKMVSQIEVGPGGYAYVVDSRDHLVAHPDSRMLREKRDLSALVQVKSARADRSASTAAAQIAMVADGLGGGQVLAAHAVIAPVLWFVFVERPAADAYSPLRAPIIRSVVIFILGLGLSMLASLFLARRMVAPIRVLQEGAARIGAGDLGHRIEIRTGDELEALGDELNRTAGQLRESYANLEQKVEERTRELGEANAGLTEALEQQTTTAEILRVISSSPTDVQPVFDIIGERSEKLCDAEISLVSTFDGEQIQLVALHGVLREGAETVRRWFPMQPSAETVSARTVRTRAVVHVEDVLADPDYEAKDAALAGGYRGSLGVPMLREGQVIGVIFVARTKPGRFTEAQVALLKTFADQAVIAIENVRLFQELGTRNRDLTEALEQQTATSEILRVISSSPTDIEPVLDALVKSATRFCGAYDAVIFLSERNILRVTAHHGPIPQDLGSVRPLERGTVVGRTLLDRRAIHVADLQAEVLEFPEGSAFARRLGHRTILSVPLLRESVAIGVIQLRRAEVNPFTDKQGALLQTFADQAVIAIENVRLFKELEARNRDLTEALEQQTATSEVLKVISRSTFDLEPVLETLIENATRLCGAEWGHIWRFDGELLQWGTDYGATRDFRDFMQHHPIRPGPGTIAGRAAAERRTVHVHDVLAEPGYQYGGLLRLQEYRTVLAVPMLREGAFLGVLTILKPKVEPFTDRQVELVESFADQAVIAIENVRLFKELEARNAELTETLARQTATGEVLRAISRAQTDAQPVFDIIAASALRLCGAGYGQVQLYDGEMIHMAASQNVNPEGAEALRHVFPRRADEGTTGGRAIRTRAVVEVPDALEDPAYGLKGVLEIMRFRSLLAVPMLRDGAPIGAIVVGRAEPGPFPHKQIELLQTFADQAVIAVENVRLFKELQARTHELGRSVEELKALGEVGQAVSSTLDLETVLTTIVSHADQLSGTNGGAIYEYDEPNEEFRLRVTLEFEDELIEALRAAPIRLGEGAVGRAGVTRRPIQIPDILDEPTYTGRLREVAERAGYRALLAVPLLREDRLLGALVLRRRVPGTFPQETIDLLQTFASQSVLAIENARLFREIEVKGRQLELARVGHRGVFGGDSHDRGVEVIAS